MAKGLFASHRGRPDLKPVIPVLQTRVKRHTEGDWDKLIRMMKYIQYTRNEVLILGAKSVSRIVWSIDASFAVHPDMRSHTGAVMMFKEGTGAIQSGSAKQKLNTDSSTTSELVGVHQYLPMVLWTPLFLKEQGYEVTENTVLQDNKSTILLEENGKSSSSKRTRALNIRYFMITDQIKRGNVNVKYCPTDNMIGDYMTKPLQGIKFDKFKREIMGSENEKEN